MRSPGSRGVVAVFGLSCTSEWVVSLSEAVGGSRRFGIAARFVLKSDRGANRCRVLLGWHDIIVRPTNCSTRFRPEAHDSTTTDRILQTQPLSREKDRATHCGSVHTDHYIICVICVTTA